MWQKAIIGLLVTTIIGATAVGIYDATQSTASEEIITVTENTVAQASTAQNGSETSSGEPVLQAQAMDSVGEPWDAVGFITEVGENGITLKLADSSEVFVELGPTAFWQEQSDLLAIGTPITVEGFFNGEQVHARTVITSNVQLDFRTETGLPLWSGGPGGGDEDHEQSQVAPDEWLNLSGVIVANSNGNVTIHTTSGEQIQTQLGQPHFWQAQGITLNAGSEISVLGYWEGSSFQAGEIIIVATGERIMLRDPNGRPLWAGPGSNTGETTPAEPANDAQANTAPDNSGETAVTEPVQQQQQVEAAVENVGDYWSGIGIITEFGENGIMLKLADSSQVFVELGPSTYWQGQSGVLELGKVIIVEGFNNEGQIHARTVETADDFQMIFRTEEGVPLWTGGTDVDSQNTNGDSHNTSSSNQNSQQNQNSEQNQVAPEEWLTFTGVIITNSNGSVTIQTLSGDQIQTQLGQPSFWRDQGITLDVGSEISILGYWEGSSFQAGEVTIVATGERIMLRDPNGRPLWGGPGGSSSDSGSNGSSGNGSDSSGNGGNSNDNGGKGNGNGGNGNGNGGNGNGNSGNSNDNNYG
jgi:hypothetical protein